MSGETCAATPRDGVLPKGLRIDVVRTTVHFANNCGHVVYETHVFTNSGHVGIHYKQFSEFYELDEYVKGTCSGSVYSQSPPPVHEFYNYD